MTVCGKHKFYDKVTDLPCKECLIELGEPVMSVYDSDRLPRKLIQDHKDPLCVMSERR